MEDFPQLAQWMQEEMRADRNRPHYENEVLIEDLWKEDKKQLKPLTISDLPIFSVDSLKVNKYGEIELDGGKFVIQKARIKQVLIIIKEWNQYSCFTNDGEVIYQEFRWYMNKTRATPWNDILDDWERKPRSVKYSRFFKYLPEKVQAYLIKNVMNII